VTREITSKRREFQDRDLLLKMADMLLFMPASFDVCSGRT
jgi:hypothetical protein